MSIETILSAKPARARSGSLWSAPATLIPAAAVLLLVLVVLFPSWFLRFPPDLANTRAVLRPPDGTHWFGTDQLGRDVYSRVVAGTRLSLFIGLGATAIAVVLGTVIGLLASIAPWGIDRVVVRLIDILLAFPELLLALLVIAVLGRGPTNTLLAVGLAGAAGYARLIRSQILRVRVSGYVEQAVALGEPQHRIVAAHIVPNTLRPLIILATIGVGSSILSASSLSFLGLGVVPPEPEWGALLADGRSFLSTGPWTSLLPAAVVAASVVSITVLGRRIQTILAKGSLS